jgi:hypothetical protein
LTANGALRQRRPSAPAATVTIVTEAGAGFRQNAAGSSRVAPTRRPRDAPGNAVEDLYDGPDEAAGHDPPRGGYAMTSAHVITLGLGADLNHSVQMWFRQFNWLPPLPLKAVRVDTLEGLGTFEHLLQLVVASPHQRFILMAHGHEDGSGLFLKLAKGSTANTEHKFVGRLVELAEGQTYNDYDKKHLGVDKEGAQRLVGLIQKVREKKIDCIEFRACNLGRDTLGLDRFRRCFGARLLGAPDLHTFFGHGPALTDPKMLATHAKGHTGGEWDTYEFPHWLRPRDTMPELVCCFRVNAHKKPAGGHIAADSPARLDAWVDKFVMPGGKPPPKGDMALHGIWNTTRQIILEPEDINEPLGGWGNGNSKHEKRLILPATGNYRKHIIYSRG